LRFSLALVVAVVCLGIGLPSYAQSKGAKAADSHYKLGKKAYTLGHFPEAIEEFEKAYDLKPEPVFLFNIAQSHRQNGNLQRAIFFYRRYLEADPGAKDRADIEKRITDAEAQLAAEKERSLAPPPPVVAPQPAPTPSPSAAPAPVPEPTPVPLAVQPAPAPPPHAGSTPGRGLLVSGIVTGSVGLLAIGGGVLSYVHANTLHNQANTGRYDKKKEDSSNTFRTVAWVAFGVGGAAVATGTILMIVGAKSKAGESSVALAPLLAPGCGGASLFGRF
jgi:tetratricopeptide (TPR) repeat protein